MAVNKRDNDSSLDEAGRLKWVLLVFGLCCVLLSLPFIWLHIAIPSDGARFSRDGRIFTGQGVIVSPYAPGASPLHDGDVVTAIDGIDVKEWSQNLIAPFLEPPRWSNGQTVTYTVLRDGKPLEIPVRLGLLPLGAILRTHWSVIIFFLVSQLVSGFVLFQRPDDPAARALFVWAFSGSHTYTWSFFLQVSDLVHPAGFWLFHASASGLWLVFWAAVVHTALVFPRPLFHLKRPARWISLIYISSFLLFAAILAWRWFTVPDLMDWLDSWGIGQTVVAAVYTLMGLVLIVVQYATSRSAVERIKTRWVIFGTVTSLGLGLVLYFVPTLVGARPVSPNVLGLINFPFIIALAIAIWRHQLFDIDLVIRRTLQYTLLTGLLSLVYFGVVALAQGVLTANRGLATDGAIAVGSLPPAVIVLTTLLIAALFNPLRRRLQDFIDRRFYRQKYDAEKALAEFAAFARSETDLDGLSKQLLMVVTTTIQPKTVNLWISETVQGKSPNQGRIKDLQNAD